MKRTILFIPEGMLGVEDAAGVAGVLTEESAGGLVVGGLYGASAEKSKVIFWERIINWSILS